MTPAAFISQVFQADFMQGMALWARRYLSCRSGASAELESPSGGFRGGLFLAGGRTECAVRLAGGGTSFSGNLDQRLVSDFLYFVLPLCASVLIFAVAQNSTDRTCLFGMACVYAVQHTEFCLSVILGNSGKGPFYTGSQLDFAGSGNGIQLDLPGHRKLAHDGRYLVTWRKAAIVGRVLTPIMGLVLNYPFRYLPGLRANFAYLL